MAAMALAADDLTAFNARHEATTQEWNPTWPDLSPPSTPSQRTPTSRVAGTSAVAMTHGDFDRIWAELRCRRTPSDTPGLHQHLCVLRQHSLCIAQFVHDGEVICRWCRQKHTGCVRVATVGMEVSAVSHKRRQLGRAVGDE